MLKRFFILALLAGGCAHQQKAPPLPSEPIGQSDRPYTAIPSYLLATSKAPPRCDIATPLPVDQQRPE